MSSPTVLIIGRSKRGFEGLLAEGFKELGIRPMVLGYEDLIPRSELKWYKGIILRKILTNEVLKDRYIALVPWLRYFNRVTINIIERLKPSAAFIVKGEALLNNTVDKIMNIVGNGKVGYFNPDDPRFMNLTLLYGHKGLNIFTPCRSCLNYLKEHLGKVTFLPFATPISLKKFPSTCSIRVPKVLFIGSLYPERLRLIRILLRERIPLILAGPGWNAFMPQGKSHFKPIYGTKYYALHRIVYSSLNIHVRSDINYKANMRVFEIAGAGGVEVSDNPREVSLFFRPNKEILVYNDENSLIEVLHEVLREGRSFLCEIAQRAREKALSRHTYTHRAKKIVISLNI